MSKIDDRNSQIVSLGLYGVSIACVIAAIAHAIWPTRVDDKTAMFLGLAAVVLIIREISKLEFPGVKLERFRQELKEDVKQVDRKVELIEDKGMLPGRVAAMQRSLPLARGNATTKEGLWNSDPNNGKFGGSPQANGRVLEAHIEPANSANSAACTIRLIVRSMDPNQHPLTGVVEFHLHPTFGKWEQYDVPVVNGVAEDEITSWGVFTVGAVADNGQTRLELDLSCVNGGTKKFYSS